MGKVNSVRLNAPPKEYPLLILALSLFISIQLSALFFHEPWADEIQAWLLARDSQSLWELLAERVRYEPVPGLWHAVLWMGAQFSTNIVVLNICSSIIATLSCALILFASPLPLWIRLLLPFSYYFGYQYSIVARNYCLTSLGVLIAAVIYPQRLKHPLLYVLALVVVANSCAQGILLASAIALSDLPLKKDDWTQKASLLKQTPVFIVGVVAAILQMLPLPADIKIINPQSRLGWHTLLPSIDESLVGLPMISLLILIASILLFYRAKILVPYLISFVFLEVFAVTTYWMKWHAGLLFLAWIFCICQCYERKHPAVSSLWWRSTMFIFLSLTVIQSARTVQFDIIYPISSLKQAAQDIQNKRVEIDSVVYADFFSQMMRAYVPPTPGKPSYWVWSYNTNQEWAVEHVIFEMIPVAKMFGLTKDTLYPKNIICIEQSAKSMEGEGYRVIKRYEGKIPWRGEYQDRIANIWVQHQ